MMVKGKEVQGKIGWKGESTGRDYIDGPRNVTGKGGGGTGKGGSKTREIGKGAEKEKGKEEKEEEWKNKTYKATGGGWWVHMTSEGWDEWKQK